MCSAFELGVRGYYWFPKLSCDVRVDDAGIVGTELDLEDDVTFDFENSGLFVALTVSF
jgi:hypothetical protein